MQSLDQGTRTSEPRPLLRSAYRSLLQMQKGVWVRPQLKVLNGRGISPRNGAAMCCIKGEAILFGGSLERVQRVARTGNLTNDLHSFRLLPAIADPEALSEAALLRALQERQAVAPDELHDQASLVQRAAEAALEPIMLSKQLQTAGESPSGRWGHSFTAVRLAVPGGGCEEAGVVLGGWPGEEGDALQPYLLRWREEGFGWEAPEISGEAPPSRAFHSATEVSPGLVLVYGGLGDLGVGDAIAVLDLDA
ncbi:hypothetical protein CYMTET_12536, partial [Cymbomonas tetramitiformis]